MNSKLRLWTIGIILAVAGVVLARVVAIRIAGAGLQFAVFLVGALLAISGLVVVLYGLRSKS